MVNKNFSVTFNQRINQFNKSIEVDSDKSLSIRSFLIGSISQNISKAKNIFGLSVLLSAICTILIPIGTCLNLKCEGTTNYLGFIYALRMGSSLIESKQGL